MRAAAGIALTGILACGARTGLGVGHRASDAGAPDAAAPTPDAAPGCLAAPTPTPLATFLPGTAAAFAFAQDDHYLYWFQWASKAPPGALVRVPKCGGPVETLSAPTPDVAGLAVDATQLFWTEANGAGRLLSMPKDGGAMAVLASLGTVPVSRIALQGGDVYFQVSQNGTNVDVVELPIGGGPTHVLGPSLGSFAVDDAYVYTRSADSGLLRLVALPKAGGKPIDLAAAPTSGGIAVDGAKIYFSDAGAYHQGVVSVTGLGVPAQTVLQGLDVPVGVALDATHVYVAEQGFDASSGVISRVPRIGGVRSVLATSEDRPEAIVVDATSVYWLDFGGRIMKLDKPQ